MVVPTCAKSSKLKSHWLLTMSSSSAGESVLQPLPIQEEEEEEEDKENGAENLATDGAQPYKGKKMKSWPHMSSLFPMYTADMRALLKAVDDTGCVKQPKAANVNPKGNKWAELYRVCYGGSPGSGRGALAFSELPIVENAVKLKRKVVQLWNHVNHFDNKKEKKITDDIVKACKNQLEQYDANCAQVNNTTEQQRRNEELQAKMLEYETGQGAIPPGAKGVKGAGRVEHSTNLRIGQPATYHWANTQSTGSDLAVAAGNPISILEVDVDANGAPVSSLATPGRSCTPGRTPKKSSLSSTQVNAMAQDRLDSFQDGMKDLTKLWQKNNTSPTVSTPEKKRRRLVQERDELREEICFQREMKDDDSVDTLTGIVTMFEKHAWFLHASLA